MMEKKDDRPLVSIFCLTYNHAPYIRQFIEGILMQRTDFLFEALIHDDASTDGTQEILQEYEKKFPNIIKPYFQKENQYSKGNISIARKINLSRMQGKYIALCEGDDYWIDPLKLQKQVDIMRKYPNCSLCGSNGLVLSENRSVRPYYFNDQFEFRLIPKKEAVSKWLFPTASILYRKEVIENYPEWTKQIYSGDLTLLLMSLTKGDVYTLGEVTCVYRKESVSSISSVADKNQLWVLKQHRLLFSLFNNDYGHLFGDLIKNKITQIDAEIDYREYKQNHYLLACFKYPWRIFKEDVIRSLFYKLIGREKTHILFH